MLRKTIVAAAFLLAAGAWLGAVRPPSDLQARDEPDDRGGSIRLNWNPSPDDRDRAVSGYLIFRAEAAEGPYQQVAKTYRGTKTILDKALTDNKDYYYRLVAVGAQGDTSDYVQCGPVRSSEQWFKGGKVNTLVATILFTLIVLFFLDRARKGRMFLRRLAGLDAVEDAVGRATEMGKPILYILGLSSISDIATIAGLNILGQVARKTAEYETPLIVPTYDPIVHTVAREVIKEGYNAKGRPDLFKEDMVFFVTSNQMGYAAAISGIMAREKPATNLFMGMFYAEAMILAEAGAATGAIQIAGTDAITQLPFFVTACDYTLMGEELYAASAYLSREPLLVGTIKAQDWSKAIIVALILFCSMLGLAFGTDAFYNWFNIK